MAQKRIETACFRERTRTVSIFKTGWRENGRWRGYRKYLIPTHRRPCPDIPILLSSRYHFFICTLREVEIVYNKGQQYRKISGLYGEDYIMPSSHLASSVMRSGDQGGSKVRSTLQDLTFST